MRKTLSLFFICLLFFSLFQNTFARNIDSYDLACFLRLTEDIVETKNNTVLIETPYKDFIAVQNGKILDKANFNTIYKYIPFESDVILENSKLAKGKYIFSQIDTKDTKEILIKLSPNTQTTGKYNMIFRYDMKYHTPEYYFSEDGEDYFLTGNSAIDDFQAKYFKIKFTPKEIEEKREIITIKDLYFERINDIYAISRIIEGSPIQIYSGYRCSLNSRQEVSQGDSEIPGTPIYKLSERQETSPLYTQKINDTDNDGIYDLQDNCKNVKNRNQKDLNQNGVGDACEFDGDSDSIPDEIDNCRNTSNPGQEDADSDGIGDTCDNCNLYNPYQRDENNDGVGDTCEQREEYISQNDSDSDGIINYGDNCKDIANPKQEDSDNDGVGNVCDNCKIYQNPKQEDINKNGIGDICEDSDKDGIDGLRDNCPNIANQDQKDSDNDGVGDVCEDDDRDKVLFSSDNCPYKYNPKQIDTDSDGIGDACDKTDNRFIESNKTLFIFLMLLITAAFMGGIFFLGKQIQKKT